MTNAEKTGKIERKIALMIILLVWYVCVCVLVDDHPVCVVCVCVLVDDHPVCVVCVRVC